MRASIALFAIACLLGTTAFAQNAAELPPANALGTPDLGGGDADGGDQGFPKWPSLGGSSSPANGAGAAGAAPTNATGAAPTNAAGAQPAQGANPAAAPQGSQPAQAAQGHQAAQGQQAGQGVANGETYEMRFQFDQRGQPSMHTFVMKWGRPDANLQSIDVFVTETNELLQTIAIPQDRVHLVWQDIITSQPNEIHEKILDSVDYNFDKFADLRLLRQWPYKVGQKFYLVWLFDEHRNQYVLNEAISALQGPTPNPKTRRIETTELGGFGGGEFVMRAYSVNFGGRIKVQTKVTQTMLDERRMVFLREVRVRRLGELQRVCKLAVPTEGEPRRLWGKLAACAPFMTKETPAK